MDSVLKGIFWYQEELACLGWYIVFSSEPFFFFNYPCLLLLFHNVLNSQLCLTSQYQLDAFGLIYKYNIKHVKLKM